MQKKAPTLKDVAERAGVSSMAVSAVLNNSKSTVRVSEATRERIKLAMSELKYQPHTTARSLRLQKTDTIGFYNGHGYINMSDPFAPNIFIGLQSGASSFANHLLLYNGMHLQPKDVVLRKLLSNKADGVVMWPAKSDIELITSLGKTDKPVVQLGDAYPGLPGVLVDDYSGARALAEYLVDRGHKRILFRRSVDKLTSETLRLEAFTDVASERGIDLIVTMSDDRSDSLTQVERDLILNKFNANPVTAVACWHDSSAVQVARFCDASGIKIPDDLSITGFDGFSLPEFGQERSLTTIAVDWQQLATLCVKLIMQRLNGEEIPERSLVSGTLVLGATA